MRYLIFALGSAGDVHPFIGLGRVLHSRDHEVIIIANPRFQTIVERSGLGFHPIGTEQDSERIQQNPDLWHPKKSFPLIIREAVNPSYPAILDIVRIYHIPRQTAIIGSSLAFGAMNPSELLDIPWITIHLAPSLFISNFRSPQIEGAPFGPHAPRFLKSIQWKLAGKYIDHTILPALNTFRKSHALTAVHDMLHCGWHSPRRVIGLFPEWFAAPQPDWPSQTRLTGFPLFDEAGLHDIPPELDSFLNSGSPPIIFTPGSAMSHGKDFFAAATESLRLLDRRGIFLTPFTHSLPPNLPTSIRHFPYIPLSQILPRAATLVYHGGIGTCSQVLKAGIPHFIQHLAHDQLDNLSRIRELGVGDGLPRRHFTPDRITPILDRLLQDTSLHNRAKQIATQFDPQSWITKTCQLIEQAST